MSDESNSAFKIDNAQPRLSLCMIVRDAERTLPTCLASIRPWVDELVVVDTGSVDQTLYIAAQFGARLFHFPWCDDFSAARNESLRHARGEWLFWMDADDTIDETNGRKLRQLAYQEHDTSIGGYVMQVHCPAGDGASDYTAVDHLKLFRNRSEMQFEGRIHEQILPAIRRIGDEIAWTDIFVTHSGSDQSAEGRRKKHERDLRILHLDNRERPDHPFVLFNLGMTYADMGRHDQAVQWLQRSIDRAQPTESHLRKAYALLVASFHQLAQFVEAETSCDQGLQLFPRDAELSFRRAMLAHEAGHLELAARAYRQALLRPPERYFISLDRGVVGAKARHNLACVYAEMQRPDLAEIQWRRVLAEDNDNTHASRLLIETLLLQRRFAAAELELVGLEERHDGSFLEILRAQLAEQRGDLVAAGAKLQHITERYADEPDSWEALGRFLFEHGKPGEAVPPLAEFAQRRPECGAAWHNLGVAQLQMGDAAAAVKSLQRSLQIRPDSVITYRQLEFAQTDLEHKQTTQTNAASEAGLTATKISNS